MVADEGCNLDSECWICFQPGNQSEPLQRPCRCPTLCHAKCLARWQLHCAGKLEEGRCRFCNNEYPDWRPVLTPPDVKTQSPVPVLSIYYSGHCTRIKVRPGPEGLQMFTTQLRQILQRDISTVNLVFRCRCPESGAELYLHGIQAWSAAIHCACVRAARRMATARHAPAAAAQSTMSPAGATQGAVPHAHGSTRAHAPARVPQPEVAASGRPQERRLHTMSAPSILPSHLASNRLAAQYDMRMAHNGSRPAFIQGGPLMQAHMHGHAQPQHMTAMPQPPAPSPPAAGSEQGRPSPQPAVQPRGRTVLAPLLGGVPNLRLSPRALQHRLQALSTEGSGPVASQEEPAPDSDFMTPMGMGSPVDSPLGSPCGLPGPTLGSDAAGDVGHTGQLQDMPSVMLTDSGSLSSNTATHNILSTTDIPSRHNISNCCQETLCMGGSRACDAAATTTTGEVAQPPEGPSQSATSQTYSQDCMHPVTGMQPEGGDALQGAGFTQQATATGQAAPKKGSSLPHQRLMAQIRAFVRALQRPEKGRAHQGAGAVTAGSPACL